MSRYSKEDIVRMVREEGVEFIRMQFTDIFGQLKNVAITASQIEKAVNNQIMIDGSSIEGFVRIQESDQYLHPDLDSYTILPWRPQTGKVARLICDVYNPDGTPFIGDPRGTLKRVLKRAEDMGYSFNVGPECEFFLFQTDEKGRPTTETSDEAGYFDLGPLDHGESTRREICMALEQMGFEIEASHHEVAAGQHEVDFKYADALTAADNIMTFKPSRRRTVCTRRSCPSPYSASTAAECIRICPCSRTAKTYSPIRPTRAVFPRKRMRLSRDCSPTFA